MGPGLLVNGKDGHKTTILIPNRDRDKELIYLWLCLLSVRLFHVDRISWKEM